MNTLVIRADSSEKIGVGHIMRCIALAQAWQECGGEVIFLISSASAPLKERIVSEGFGVSFLDREPGSREDAGQTIALAWQNKARWIIIDGYQFGDEYQEQVKNGGHKILVVDDYGHAKNIHADIVVNPNIYASMALYPHHNPATRFLMGRKYILLRREFQKKRGLIPCMEAVPATNILVTMGGSDPDNVTATILETIRPLIDEFCLSVTAVVGMMNRQFDVSSPYSANGTSVKVLQAPNEMPELIRKADIVISGAGSTAWEVAFLGRPMIAVVLTANQEKVGGALRQAGAAQVIEDCTKVPQILGYALRDLLESPQNRKKIADAGRKLVDGDGPGRIIMTMQGSTLRLRDVRMEDKDLLLRWANDPVVRINAFCKDPIDPATHERWFEEKMASLSSTIYIAIDPDEIPVGQVRFDRDGKSAEVDISIDTCRRGKGLGIELLSLGTAKIFHNTDISTITASVKTENPASVRMFKQAGFSDMGKEMVGGSQVLRFIRHRPESS